MNFWTILMIIIGFWLLNSYSKNRARRDKIYKKYGHTDIAEKIIKKTVWVGETTEQLIDSIGKPVDIDQSVMKTKTKQVWKYEQTGTNRFRLRMKVEDGVVVGWDEKL